MNPETEKLLQDALKALVYYVKWATAPHVAQPPKNAVRTQKAPHKEQGYSNGIPICPVHDKAMKEGQYGWYCTSKEDDPELANKNGYCSYKVK